MKPSPGHEGTVVKLSSAHGENCNTHGVHMGELSLMMKQHSKGDTEKLSTGRALRPSLCLTGQISVTKSRSSLSLCRLCLGLINHSTFPDKHRHDFRMRRFECSVGAT